MGRGKRTKDEPAVRVAGSGLTQSQCPIFRMSKVVPQLVVESSAESKRQSVIEALDDNDPLFGLIPASLLGIDPISGRPKITKEVLEDMRVYILAANGPEMMARKERVRKSIVDLENDPIGEKTFLRLEPHPSVTKELDKGKGVVFDFSDNAKMSQRPEKLMANAISSRLKVLQSGRIVSERPFLIDPSASSHSSFLVESSTGCSADFHESNASGTQLKKPKSRKRPGTFTRKINGKNIMKTDADNGKKIGDGIATETKKKAQEDVEPSQSSARFKKPMTVPVEGPSSV